MTIKVQVSSNFPALPVETGAIQTVTAAGTTTILPATQTLIFNKSVASASPCNLPAGSTRDRVPLDIYDWTGKAGDITLTPAGIDQIMGAASPWTITSGGIAQSGGHQTLTYYNSIPGWLVK